MKHLTRINSLYLTGILLFLVFSHATAKNRITVASVSGGAATFKIDIQADAQNIVEQVIDEWGKRLDPVIAYQPDLIVLAEECDLPTFHWTNEIRDHYFKVRGNQLVEYFGSVAKENHCYIAFGMYTEANDGKWYDSGIVLDRDGQQVGVYNKNYPTDEEMKSGEVVPGTEIPLIQCDFGTVSPVICFDLNYDEFRQRYARLNPDIILFSSMYHGGDFLQSYWAYSCRSYFVSSQFNYNVPSEIRNPLGEVVGTSTNYTDFAVAEINLDFGLAHWGGNRVKIKALKEKYGNRVVINDPGLSAVVMISSEDEQLSAEEMMQEFGIESLDDMLNRTRELRNHFLK